MECSDPLRRRVRGPIRFTELECSIEGVSRRMLTLTLRNLERDGLVGRSIYPTVPPQSRVHRNADATGAAHPHRRLHEVGRAPSRRRRRGPTGLPPSQLRRSLPHQGIGQEIPVGREPAGERAMGSLIHEYEVVARVRIKFFRISRLCRLHDSETRYFPYAGSSGFRGVHLT
jgi:hypothetical protein